MNTFFHNRTLPQKMLIKDFRPLLLLCFTFTTFFNAQLLAAEDNILIPASPEIAASSYLLQDFNSGKILVEKDIDQILPPASLTKIMTVYVVFNELRSGHLTLDEFATISQKAWKTPGSRMFVEVNKQVKIEDLLKGVIIQSGNDASVALAEHVAGDEATFARLMNQHAQSLGMSNSHFTNSTGLPDPEHYTTARDLAILTRAVIREFPEYYRWDSQKEFTYNKITQQNRNKLLWRDESVDGVKTGHTEEAGYCLVASAKREDMRLVSVVMGTRSVNARANETQTLLNYGFRFFETYLLYKGNETLTETRVWKGDEKNLQLGVMDDFYVTIPRHHYNDLKAVMTTESNLNAPIAKGETIGSINVSLAGQTIAEKPLVALKAMEKGNFIRRIFDQAMLLLE